MAILPRNRTAAGEDRADHKEKNNLDGPSEGRVEYIAADDIGEIDRNGADQEDG